MCGIVAQIVFEKIRMFKFLRHDFSRGDRIFDESFFCVPPTFINCPYIKIARNILSPLRCSLANGLVSLARRLSRL